MSKLLFGMLSQFQREGVTFSSRCKHLLNENHTFKKLMGIVQKREKFMKRHSTVLFALEASDSESETSDSESEASDSDTGAETPSKRKRAEGTPSPKKSPRREESPVSTPVKKTPSKPPRRSPRRTRNKPTPRTGGVDPSTMKMVDLVSPQQAVRKSKRTPSAQKKKLDIKKFQVNHL